MRFKHSLANLNYFIFISFFTFLIFQLSQKYLNQSTLNVFILSAICLIYLFILILKKGTLNELWTHIRKEFPDNQHPSILEDFLLEKGTFPNAPLKQHAIETHENNLPPYPWFRIWQHYLKTCPIYISFILLFIILNLFILPKQTNENFTLEITSPDYLNLKPRTIHEPQKNIYLFSGSLVKFKTLTGESIKDLNNNTYLPIQELKNNSVYEIRILHNTTLKFQSANNSISFKIIPDKKPLVEWIKPPQNTNWKPLKLKYSSEDDFGLADNFITINGDEIEYAGSASGLMKYRYQWKFEPLEFINLEGGNLILQITSYDSDTINGPKASLSPPLIWSYEGVENENTKSIDLIQLIQKKIDERLASLIKKPLPKDQQLQSNFKQLDQNLQKSPILSDQLKRLSKEIPEGYETLWTKYKKPSPQSQFEEVDELQKDNLYLKQIESHLKSILNTVKSSKLAKKINELSEKLSDNKEIKENEFDELFEEAAKLMKDMNIPDHIAKEMLGKIEQSALANMLGEKQKASDLLQESLSMLQQMDEMQNSQSPLAEKFKETMDELSHLLKQQLQNQKALNDYLKSKDKKEEALKQIKNNQEKLTKESKQFSKTFRQFFEPILQSPYFFSYADQAASFTQQAQNKLKQQGGQAYQNMRMASQRWQILLQGLHRMQQQQQQMMAGQRRLRIGKDGKLQFQSEKRMNQGEQDQDIKDQQEDIDIALPEDFQKARNIESFLKNELKLLEEGKQKSKFKEYIYNLLE